MKNKTLIIGIVVAVVVVIVGIVVGVMVMKVPKPNYEEGYTLYMLDVEKVENDVSDMKLKAGDYIDVYVNDESITIDEINEPLFTKAEIFAVRDKDGKNIDNSEGAQYILFYAPDDCYSVLRMLDFVSDVTLTVEKKSHWFSEQEVNEKLREELEGKYTVDIDVEGE